MPRAIFIWINLTAAYYLKQFSKFYTPQCWRRFISIFDIVPPHPIRMTQTHGSKDNLALSLANIYRTKTMARGLMCKISALKPTVISNRSLRVRAESSLLSISIGTFVNIMRAKCHGITTAYFPHIKKMTTTTTTTSRFISIFFCIFHVNDKTKL